jgi:hypothetical protein
MRYTTNFDRVPLENRVMWPELGLHSMVIFANHARDGRFSADGLQPGEFGRIPDRPHPDVRRTLLSELVRPVPVVMDQVLAEYQSQVVFAEDQYPVQEFAAEASDDAFADGVHPWGLRQGGDDPQAFGLEHLGERGGEERVTIANQEPQRADAVAQVHGQVAGLLYRPRSGRVCGHSGQVESSGAAFDEHQHVQPLEQHRHPPPESRRR